MDHGVLARQRDCNADTGSYENVTVGVEASQGVLDLIQGVGGYRIPPYKITKVEECRHASEHCWRDMAGNCCEINLD
jgi:hypothetical protein